MNRLLIFCFTYIFFSIYCKNADNVKSVEIYSKSINESVKNNYFIDSLILNACSDSYKSNPKVINFWSEEAWKCEKSYFNKKNTKLPFANLFLKLDKTNYKIKYKKKSSDSWQNASIIIEPPLGYYLQVSNYRKGDSILIYISNGVDSCIAIAK